MQVRRAWKAIAVRKDRGAPGWKTVVKVLIAVREGVCSRFV